MKANLNRIKSLVSKVLIVVIILTTASCKNQKSRNAGSGDMVDTEKIENKDAIIREISDYPLPTSFQVTTLLVEAGASYILDLCNNINNVGKYMNLKSKALNLGVYGADLSYAATYNQTQETMQYLSTSAKLIDELHIGSFNESLVKNVESNIDNLDSLITLISDSFYSTYEYLNSNEQDELSILVMAGSWIEALYITTQISIISSDNSKIIEIINEQRTSLDKLMEVMVPVSGSEMSSDIFNGLFVLQEIYKKSEGNLSGEQLEKLVEQTEILRTSIVS